MSLAIRFISTRLLAWLIRPDCERRTHCLLSLPGLALLSMLVASGCQKVEDPALLSARQKYLLQNEPSGAESVQEVRKKAAQAEVPVVLVGRIGAGVDSTWDPGKAAFVVWDSVAQSPTHAHEGAGHDHENCPFCKAEKKARVDNTALVRIADPLGQVVPFDARKLFSIHEDQIVVVRGLASIDALGNLVVKADGVYPREQP